MSDKTRRSKFLGMNLGTASNRLRKLVLFKLVQETGQDGCFRCGKVISLAGELSIEHKKSWLDVDPALFWDLDNIAFSHLRCNSANGERKNREKTHCPEGHRYSEGNTRQKGSWRICRACDRDRWHRRNSEVAK